MHCLVLTGLYSLNGTLYASHALWTSTLVDSQGPSICCIGDFDRNFRCTGELQDIYVVKSHGFILKSELYNGSEFGMILIGSV